MPSSTSSHKPRPLPWQVWLIDFDPQVGREQTKRRPGIVVGSSAACRLPNELVIVVPCTSNIRNHTWQPVVQLDKPSAAMCDQVTSISHQRLVELLPHTLKQSEIDEVRFVLGRLIG